jgi:hypothetical protein
VTENLPISALARQILLRHRSDGHLRFDLPAPLCEGPVAAALEGHLRGLAGVYRVTVYRSQGKLSIFFDHHACTLHEVVRHLHAGLAACLALAGSPPARSETEADAVQPAAAGGRIHPWSWVRQKTDQARARLADLKDKARLITQIVRLQAEHQPMLKSALSEKAAINFFNDIVVFYLIKVHWDMITGQWLKQPLKYRNAWLSTFYLVFLLVRYRKLGMKKP